MRCGLLKLTFHLYSKKTHPSCILNLDTCSFKGSMKIVYKHKQLLSSSGPLKVHGVACVSASKLTVNLGWQNLCVFWLLLVTSGPFDVYKP